MKKIISLLFVLIPPLLTAMPAFSASLLFVCGNGGQMYNKETKKGPITLTALNVAGSVTIDASTMTSELVVGSRTNEIIGQRSNANLNVVREEQNGEVLLTGMTSDQSIYFTYYTTKNELFASYRDIVLKFKGCVDFGKSK